MSILLPSNDRFNQSQSQSPFHLAAASVLVGFWALFVRQRSPWTFYIYIIFPCYFWNQVLVRATRPLLHYIRQGQSGSVFGPVLRGVLVVAALQSMVVSTCSRLRIHVSLTNFRLDILTAQYGVLGSLSSVCSGLWSHGRPQCGARTGCYG